MLRVLALCYPQYNLPSLPTEVQANRVKALCFGWIGATAGDAQIKLLLCSGINPGAARVSCMVLGIELGLAACKASAEALGELSSPHNCFVSALGPGCAYAYTHKHAHM